MAGFYEDYLRRMGLPPVMIGHDSGSRRRSAYNPYTVRVSEPEALGGSPIVERGTGQHAVGYNKGGFGLAYNAPVGSMPSAGVMSQLQREVEAENFRRGNLTPMDFRGHGEADYLYQTGTDPRQATATKRDWGEASWRPYATALHDRSQIGVDPTGGDIRFNYDPATGANNIGEFAVPGGFQGVGPGPAAPLGASTGGGGPAGGAAPAVAGGGLLGWLDRFSQDPRALAGLMMVAGRSPTEGAQIAQALYERQYKQQQMEEQRRQFDLGYGLRSKEDIRQEAERGEKATLFQQEQADKARRDKLFAEMYPGGKPNMAHPGFTGLTQDEAEAAYGLGPEEGMKKLGNLRFETATTRAKFVEQVKQQQARLQAWRQSQGIGAAPTPAPAGPAAAAPAPSPGLALPLPPELQPRSAAPTPFQSAIPGAAPAQTPAPAAPAGAPPGPAGGAPAPAFGAPMIQQQGGGLPIMPQAAPVASMPQLPGYNSIDPYANAAIEANILLGDKAADAVEKAGAQYRAAQLAGPTKYIETEATERAKHRVGEEKKVQGAIEMWGHLDRLERSAKALGTVRLTDAASPALDSWFGRNFLRKAAGDQAWNDRQLLLANVDQMIVQARETQRGLGPLTEGEQAVLEAAYAGMKSATNAKAFFNHIETLRQVLASKIPGANYDQAWIKQGEEAAKEQQGG